MQGLHRSVDIFCSYAHSDETWRQQLDTHLSLMHRQGLISTWYDRQIVPGTDWAQAIDAHLNSASVILLLISSDFFASNYCYGIEMKRALERHQTNETRVIPILLRPVDWKGAPFAHLQALPTNAKPITTWSNRDEAFTDVATGIRRAIEDLANLSASTTRATLPMEEFRYDAFIGYSHKDAAWIEQVLLPRLQKERIHYHYDADSCIKTQFLGKVAT